MTLTKSCIAELRKLCDRKLTGPFTEAGFIYEARNSLRLALNEIDRLNARVKELERVAKEADRFDRYVCEFGLEQALCLGDLYQPLHDAIAALKPADAGEGEV